MSEIIIHKPIVDECRLDPVCRKIFLDDDATKKCRTYCNPAAIQHRCGIMDACPIKPKALKVTKAKQVVKRKFGRKGR
jgi:hypothetical protein